MANSHTAGSSFIEAGWNTMVPSLSSDSTKIGPISVSTSLTRGTAMIRSAWVMMARGGLDMVRTCLRGMASSKAFGPPGKARSRRFDRCALLLEILEDRLVPSADLSVSLNAAPNPVIAGDQLQYTIVVQNNGPDNATGVTLTDRLPTGASY